VERQTGQRYKGLETETGKKGRRVNIIRYDNINQQSGEDWHNGDGPVALVFSDWQN